MTSAPVFKRAIPQASSICGSFALLTSLLVSAGTLAQGPRRYAYCEWQDARLGGRWALFFSDVFPIPSSVEAYNSRSTPFDEYEAAHPNPDPALLSPQLARLFLRSIHPDGPNPFEARCWVMNGRERVEEMRRWMRDTVVRNGHPVVETHWKYPSPTKQFSPGREADPSKAKK
jgi:hypothetical protein